MMVTLIILDVHARDVIDNLIKANIHSITHFDWIKNLRYYWEKDIDNCVVR